MRVAHLARKPIAEGSAGRNILAHGTGGINIDASRIAGAPRNPGYVGRDIQSLGMFQNTDNHYLIGYQTPTGRWPSNTILIHKPECRLVGTKAIKGITGTAAGKMAGKNRNVVYGNYRGSPDAGKRTGYVSEDGTETVDAWECTPGCPVAELDSQSGITQSGAMRHEVEAYEGESTTGFLRGRSGPSNQHGGSGGASRFFKQVRGKPHHG